MKSNLLILIVLLTYSMGTEQLLAQDNSELKSFKIFEFGSSPNDVNGRLQLDLTISYGLKYYKYKSKNFKELYGQKIHDINLGFRDDQLEYIDMYFAKLDLDGFNDIREGLDLELGNSNRFEAVEKGVIASFRWKIGETTIDFYQYNDEAIDLDDRNKTVLAISKPLN